MNYFDDLQNYFNKLLKKTGGKGFYHLFEYNLSEARKDFKIDWVGDQLIITELGDQAYIKLNDIENNLIPLKIVRNIGPTPLKKFYLTNDAGTGNLKILAGSKMLFKISTLSPIEVYSQTVDRVVIRDQDGIIESSDDASRVIAGGGTEHDFVDITGKGSLRWFYVNVNAKAGSTNIKPKIYIDGTLLEPAISFGGWSALGMDANTRPFQLTDYNAGGTNAGHYYFEKGIVFDTSLKLSVYNSSVDNQTVTARWFYQLIS